MALQKVMQACQKASRVCEQGYPKLSTVTIEQKRKETQKEKNILAKELPLEALSMNRKARTKSLFSRIVAGADTCGPPCWGYSIISIKPRSDTYLLRHERCAGELVLVDCTQKLRVRNFIYLSRRSFGTAARGSSMQCYKFGVFINERGGSSPVKSTCAVNVSLFSCKKSPASCAGQTGEICVLRRRPAVQVLLQQKLVWPVYGTEK